MVPNIGTNNLVHLSLLCNSHSDGVRFATMGTVCALKRIRRLKNLNNPNMGYMDPKVNIKFFKTDFKLGLEWKFGVVKKL